jgi:hypothetical protein
MKIIASVLLAASLTTVTSAVSRDRQFINDHDRFTLADTSSASKRPNPRALTIINDDFEKARAEANKGKLPLFVEVWAPW